MDPPASLSERARRRTFLEYPIVNRPTLGLTLDSMWSIKDYVLSGALKALADDGPIVAWVPPRFLEGTRHLVAATGSRGVTIRPFRAFRPGPAFATVCKLQKSLRYERYDVATEQVLKRRRAGTVVRARGPAENGVAAIVRVVAKSRYASPAERLLARIRHRLVPSTLYTQEFTQTGVGMVMTTDPTKRDEDPVYFEAKRRRLPLTTLVLSWDHLTSKGLIHGAFDKVMVWNEVMRDETSLLYPWYRSEQIAIVGFPRFDIYRAPFAPAFERGPFLRSLGLDPSRPYLLYASSAAKAFRAQWEVAEHVCQALERNELGNGIQLLIRSHPHDDIRELERFRGRRDVSVWPEPQRGKAGTLYEQLPSADELLVLAASVAHSAAVITAGSSLMLDAARCNVPIVCVAYDGDQVLPPEDSVASVYGYSHQQPLHELGATDMCHSRQELLATIRRALTDPDRRAANRTRLVNRYLGGYGSSIERIRGVINDLAPACSPMRS